MAGGSPSRARVLVIALTVFAAGCGISFGDPDLGGVAAPPRRDADAGATKQDETTLHETKTAPLPGVGDASTAPTTRVAFVSSAEENGDLGGVDGADALCNALAKVASLPGKYRAWISTAKVDAIDRIEASGPWRRVDGKIVAKDKTQLASGQLDNPLDVDERGRTAPDDDDHVWTATGANGRYVGGSDCHAWTGGGWGHVGDAEHDGEKWTSRFDDDCSWPNRIYCFQD